MDFERGWILIVYQENINKKKLPTKGLRVRGNNDSIKK